MNDTNTKIPKAGNARKAMKEGLRLAGKLGTGTADLLRRMKKDRSPQAMIESLDTDLAVNASRREEVSGRVERLYRDIASKKAEHQKAPKARQRVLEAELRSMLSTYKAAERELKILLENERNLSLVKGRLNEVAAYGMAGVSETVIDDVIDNIEDKVVDAETVADAARDLEKAGRRKERESDREDLWTELDAFGEANAPNELTQELADFENEPTKTVPPDEMPNRMKEE